MIHIARYKKGLVVAGEQSYYAADETYCGLKVANVETQRARDNDNVLELFITTTADCQQCLQMVGANRPGRF